MEKSIENIWKDGFLKNDALVAPKLNNLYEKKSTHIIDKLTRMFRVNTYFIIGLALFHLVGVTILGLPYLAVFLCLLFYPIINYSRKHKQAMADIDQIGSSYEYLKSFDNWLKNWLSGLGKIYRFFYPLYFTGVLLVIFFSNLFNLGSENTLMDIILNDPDTYLVLGLPILWIITSLILVGLAGYFALELYRFDLNIIYGRIFKKLEELLKDIEELRKDDSLV